ncbi:865_t:CDS:1, partial [Diversispora eburnea]
KFQDYENVHLFEDYVKKYHPNKYNIWSEFKKAEDKRLEMIESKKSFVKNPGYEHPNSRYYSRSLNSILEYINSTVS